MTQEERLATIAPVFAVADAPAAAAYYTGKLGFAIAFQWADEDDGPVRYVILRGGGCDLHLSQGSEARPSVAYVFVDGVEAYYAQARAASAAISRPLKDWPWNMREFEVTDPDGNRLIFGEDLSRIEG